MNKILSVIGIIMLLFIVSCDSAGSGSSDSENPAEAAGALAVAGAVMGDYSLSAGAPPYLTSPPFLTAASDQEIPDGYGNIAIYSLLNNTINFDNFHVIYDDNQYILNGLIDIDYSDDSELYTVTVSFTGNISVEGGSLSGTYSVDIDVALSLDISDSIVVTGSVTGTVDGESVSITINETIPVP